MKKTIIDRELFAVKKVLLSIIIVGLSLSGCRVKKVQQERICARIDIDRIEQLFPKTAEDIEMIVQDTLCKMQEALSDIMAVKPICRTYINTALRYEQTYLVFTMNQKMLSVIASLSDDVQLQLAANLGAQELESFKNQYIDNNLELYTAFAEYQEFGKDSYHATKPIQFFLQYMAHKAGREGLLLETSKQFELEQMKQELQSLSGLYYSNILYDVRHIAIPLSDMLGVPESCMKQLNVDEYGNYIVPSFESVCTTILQHCTVASTRKKVYDLLGQIAYPQNEPTVQSIVQKYQEIARVFGYNNYAEYQASNLMFKNCKKAEIFIWSLYKEIQLLVDRDYKKMLRNLPSGVVLTSKGLLQPWDVLFVRHWFVQKMYHVQSDALKSYFSLEQVIPAMLKQLQTIFHVSFEPQQEVSMWSSGIQAYRVRSLKNQAVLGFLMFDMYDRSGKNIKEMCSMTLIPAIRDDCSIACVGASVVAAKFQQTEEHDPVLLTLSEVKKLFCEIGHGLHDIFGATRFTIFSGNHISKDFSEVGASVLEYLFDEPEMWKALGKHIQTGQPLPQSTINAIIATQKFERAHAALDQIFLSLVSLNIFKYGHEKSIHDIIMKLYKKIYTHVAYDPNYHWQTHMQQIIMHDQSTYYTHPLSMVVAADIVHYMKQKGLWTREVGAAYVTDILSPGGSQQPSSMIRKFLGRNYTIHSYMLLLK